MNFIHNDLGYRSGDEVVVVTLDKAANVRLMDSSNFSSYQRGGQHRYIGGHVTRTPYRVAIPHAGHWHVAIDLGGYGGSVRASVHVHG